MRTLAVLLLLAVALAALSESGDVGHLLAGEAKSEVLQRSKRRWVLSTIELTEEEPGPYPRKISQMFNDQKENTENSHNRLYKLSGTGVTEDPLGVFSIDEHTGEVYVHGPVDREKYELFHIKFDILDKSTGQKADKELAFDVEITDINDNAPTFFHPKIRANVKENTEEGYLPVRLVAVDIDQRHTPNSNVTMRVVSQTPSEPKIVLKQLDDRVGQLQLKGCFDYDKEKKYEMIIEARDHGKPSLSSSAVVTINIVDTNTHQPVFKEVKYTGSVLEGTKKNDVLRVSVDDKDTPKTPGWQAKYFFIKGNEDGHYKIETDPETNEGILSVIKEKDFEKGELSTVEIGVENIEALFVCKDFSPSALKLPPPASVNVEIEVIDVNDPPYFEKDTNQVYVKEELEPGKVVFTPVVKDPDSDVSKIRFKVLSDPANWVEIDEKTGKLKTVKKMDRESPFVNGGVYNVTIGAIDNGKPPATGTGTILIHLGDINDNEPRLVDNQIILCGNRGNKATVLAQDPDDPPYAGPFIFSFKDPDESVKETWKIDPAVGMQGGLVSKKPLPYGNYTVDLWLQDQQGHRGESTAVVVVCDCGDADVCREKDPLTTSGGAGLIGAIIAALLLFLLLLCLCMCHCGKKAFDNLPITQDEGNQTLIKYNQEGGGAESTAKPTTLLLAPTSTNTVTDGLKVATRQVSHTEGITAKNPNQYSSGFTMIHNQNEGNMTAMGMSSGQRETLLRGQEAHGTFSGWNSHMSNGYQQGSTLRHQSSFNMYSHQKLAEHLDKRLHVVDARDEDFPMYRPHEYGYEGEGSRCQSLDKLSLHNAGDELQFLDDLGPKFKTLGNICRQKVQDQNPPL